ncbi:MAG: hypothetical protein U5L06_11765 [Rhodovibrio sp.]|nr:hypothetical protein [Rhodovibrio sp.]
MVARVIAAGCGRRRAARGDGTAPASSWSQGGSSRRGASAPLTRLPYFCSGCPHNTSTKVPDGSRALAGIGCHYMVQWMDRNTQTFTQMGGEGVPWIGQAPFSTTRHVFVNLGDGTYFHSGSLAVRAAVARRASTSPSRSSTTTRSR